MRLIDTPDVPVIGITEATTMLGYIDHTSARFLMKRFRLESRPARPGELRTQGRIVYLHREVEQLAWLRRKYNGRIPARLWYVSFDHKQTHRIYGKEATGVFIDEAAELALPPPSMPK